MLLPKFRNLFFADETIANLCFQFFANLNIELPAEIVATSKSPKVFMFKIRENSTEEYRTECLTDFISQFCYIGMQMGPVPVALGRLLLIKEAYENIPFARNR